ncbi:MAG TPA: 30S ribosomal protein S21 [Clostridia bacterium]
MSTVKVTDKETIDDAIKRWKRKCQKDNIISDLRRKEHYEKPSVRRKKKKEAAKKRKAKAK